jgi:hypothetical protein
MSEPTLTAWADAIALRISDEWSGSSGEPEDAAVLRRSLREALIAAPTACARLIGTGVIESDYFDPLV